MRMAASAAGNVEIVELNDAVCPGLDSTCVPIVGDVLVYRQSSHLTNTYVLTLNDLMYKRLVPKIEGTN